MDFPEWWAGLDSELRPMLMQRFREGPPSGCTVVEGSTPVVAFGRFLQAKAATISLNPSPHEFDKNSGRFHTLSSLGLSSYQQIEEQHAVTILDLCQTYFEREVQWRWFPPLNQFILDMANKSYATGELCHLDISPWATTSLWRDLSEAQRSKLVSPLDQEILRLFVKNMSFTTLFLNGRTTAESILTDFLDIKYATYTLPASRSVKVYYARTDELFGVKLNRNVEVFGWNFYLQNGVEKEHKNVTIDKYQSLSFQDDNDDMD